MCVYIVYIYIYIEWYPQFGRVIATPFETPRDFACANWFVKRERFVITLVYLKVSAVSFTKIRPATFSTYFLPFERYIWVWYQVSLSRGASIRFASREVARLRETWRGEWYKSIDVISTRTIVRGSKPMATLFPSRSCDRAVSRERPSYSHPSGGC